MEKVDPRIAFAIVLLCICVVLQVLTLHSVNDAIKAVNMVAERPITVPGGGGTFSFPYQSLRGYVSGGMDVDPGYYQNGKVAGIAQFVLEAKVPGSRVMLRYRLNADEQWRETAMKQDEPLQYLARVTLGVTDKVEYQEIQIVGNEIVQASDVLSTDMGQYFGTGDISVHSTQTGTNELRLDFDSRAMVDALQVAEIRLEINKTTPQVIVLSGDPWYCTFESAGFKDVTVTATYRDGTVRIATYQLYDENLVIKR